MPITSIISQPLANSLNAAYRPIVFTVSATATGGGTPPVVYCDIYVNDIYYKSQEKTQSFNGIWQFDIQDACQEILRSTIGANGGIDIITASNSFATVFCKFRSSGYDADGFITPENTAPIQGTGSTNPVSGTGTQSNTFYVLNSTLQHASNQDLAQHLSYYKQGTWDAQAWPLTHRGRVIDGNASSYQVCENSSDYFPIVYTGSDTLSCIQINYTLKDGSTGSANDCGVAPASCPIVSGISIDSVDNGNGTQTFTFSWNPPDPLLTSIGIYYRPHVVTGQILTFDRGSNPVGWGGIDFIDGVYTDLPVYSITGTGSGATCNVTVVGNAVTDFAIVNPGSGYAVDDLIRPDYSINGDQYSRRVASVTIAGSSTLLANVSPTGPHTGILPLGVYDFYFTMNGGCTTTTSSTFTSQGIVAPACVPVAIVGSPSLADGHSGVGYSSSFTVSGDAPFTLSAITKPAWMTISVSGNTINFTGAPTISDEGTGINVGVTINNACGSVDFSDTINITSLARTLTFTVTLSHTSYSQIWAILNGPIDVDLKIVNMLAAGYVNGTCLGSPEASVQAHDLTILAGGTNQSGSVFPAGDWSTINSFTITDTSIQVGVFNGFVFPGDVITMGSYSVTILYDGC